jgi:Uma2 family endonuclease
MSDNIRPNHVHLATEVSPVERIDRADGQRYAAAMKHAPFTSKRWRRVEYERLVDVGALEGEPIELIGGQLIVAEPKGSPHAACVEMVSDALRAALPPGWIVRAQNPIALDDESAPEPDVAVVHGRHAEYRHAHPTRAALIVEIAESSLAFDRLQKGSLYARAGIADYWIVNLVDRLVEVYRDPGPDLTAPFGWRYSSMERFRPPAAVTPLAVPASPVAVAELLP